MPALGVERHAGPAIGPARSLPRIARPCVMPEFGGLWHGVEDPFALASARVVGANMARRFGVRPFATASAHDHQIFEHHHRARVTEVEPLHILVIELVHQVDRALLAKPVVEFAGHRVDTVDAVLYGGKNAFVAPFLEVGYAAAVAGRAAGVAPAKRIPRPFTLASGWVDGVDLEHGRSDIHRAIDDDRCALDRGGGPLLRIAGVMAPGDLQLTHVGLVDTRHRRVARSVGVAAVVTPLVCGRLGLGEQGRRGGGDEFSSAHGGNRQYIGRGKKETAESEDSAVWYCLVGVIRRCTSATAGRRSRR